MKFRLNYYTIFFNLLLLSLVLLPQNIFSQPLFELSGNGNRISKSRNSVIEINSKGIRFQLFKSIGVKLGYTTNEYGWHHPYPVITQNYRDPGISSSWIGAYLEVLSTDYFSTVLDAAYRGRRMNFEYNLYDGNGNVIGTNSSDNSFNLESFCITEKIKYTKKFGSYELNIYGFGGFKFDEITSVKPDWHMEPYLSTYNIDASGFITGIGISIGKKFRFSTELYYSKNFTNTYETEYGNYNNTEIGIVVGLGYNLIK